MLIFGDAKRVSRVFYEPRYRPSLIQKELVDAGAWGRKSKQGFYSYNEKNQYETFQPQAVVAKSVDAHIQLKVLGLRYLHF